MDELSQGGEQQPNSVSEVDEGLIARCEAVLVELSRSLKAVNFYPRGHPTLGTSLERTRNALAQALETNEQLGLSVSKDGFTFQAKPIAPNNSTLGPLARELYHRQIKKIFFLPDVTDQEVENFLRVIAMEADLFRGEGKAEEYLADNGVEHIWANEIKFGQTRTLPKKEEPPDEEVDLDERLKQLIGALRTEKDPRKFLASAREASITALRFISEENFDGAFLILKVFWEIMTEDPPRAVLISEGAKSAFSELTGPDMLEYLLRQLTLLHGPRQEEMIEVAKALEGRLADAILDKLASNEALYSHRALIQVLLQMPEISRESIEARLEDTNWYVVRKMAFLLGEIGHEESVEPLIRAAGHPDPRVVKETCKSLSKIKTINSTRYLVGLLTSKASWEIRAHVMRLLSSTGEVSVVPTLIKYLKGRGALLENMDMYRETIRALAQIGSQQAVPILEEILFKRSLLAKSRSLTLSIEAAEALGNIGGKVALEALKKGAKNQNQEKQTACRKALQAHEGPSTEPPAERESDTESKPTTENNSEGK